MGSCLANPSNPENQRPSKEKLYAFGKVKNFQSDIHHPWDFKHIDSMIKSGLDHNIILEKNEI